MTLEELYRLLPSGHVQIQGIVDTLQEPLVVLDKGFAVISANPAFFRTFRAKREDTLGQSLFALGDGQWDIPDLRGLLVDVVPKAIAIVGYRVECDFPDLGKRSMLLSARRLLHPDDNSTQMLVVFEDVTEQEKADAKKDVLIAETRHRMKNLMAMVRSMARQIEPRGLTGEQYRDIFMGRLEALLGAQELISANGADADLAHLVDHALRPIAGDRLLVAGGRKATVTQYQVTPLSMILHELATNALKYGALSNSSGTVHIGWETEQRADGPHLLVDWREVGGPPVVPPKRRGFGTELVDYSARAEGGEAVIDFHPDGVHVRLSLPVRP